MPVSNAIDNKKHQLEVRERPPPSGSTPLLKRLRSSTKAEDAGTAPLSTNDPIVREASVLEQAEQRSERANLAELVAEDIHLDPTENECK